VEQPNPNWPRVEYAICWQKGPGASADWYYWTDVTDRTEGQFGVQRGKTYELDQVQPGTATLSLRNDDGMFDPSNAASPWSGKLIPYRLFRARAQYPATANLLDPDQATALYASKGASGAGTTMPDLMTTLGGLSIVNVGSTNHYRVAVAAGDTGDGIGFGGTPVVPGANYAFSAEISATVANQWALQFVWKDPANNVVKTTTGTPANPSTTGTLFTVTDTAPANAAGLFMYVTQNNVAAPSAYTAELWNLQLEQGAAPTAFVTPGTWYPLFTGYIERWPQSWSSGGNYGLTKVTAVDLFGFLANRGLDWVGYMEMLNLQPDWFYPLDEGAGATEFHDLTGKCPPVHLVGFSAKYGGAVGQFSAGASLSGSGTGTPIGIPGPVVSFGNADNAGYSSTNVIDLSGTGKVGPPGRAGTGWTRIWAVNPGFPSKPGANSGGRDWWVCGPYPDPVNNGYTCEVSNGQGTGVFGKLGHWAFMGLDAGMVADGNWHLCAVTWSADGLTVKCYVDGKQTATATTASNVQPKCDVDYLGGFHTNGGSDGYPGPMGFVAQLPYEATSSDMYALFLGYQQAWSSGSAGYESSDVRYQRVAYWGGAQDVVMRLGAGSLKSYGPATDIQGGTSPTSTLAALQAVVDSECGQQFIGVDGAIVFQGRSARFNMAPTVVFGEAAGEVAYQGAVIDFDPTRIGNLVTVTAQSQQTANQSSVTVGDATSQTDYGTMTFQRTVNTIDPVELEAVGEGLLFQNKQPLPRLESLPINVAANPSTWATLLGLELGQCVQVNRRPANAPAISITGFVEQIKWTLSETGTAVCSLQISNAAAHDFCVLNDATYGLLDSTAVLGF
jgi:hypothetical protein